MAMSRTSSTVKPTGLLLVYTWGTAAADMAPTSRETYTGRFGPVALGMVREESTFLNWYAAVDLDAGLRKCLPYQIT